MAIGDPINQPIPAVGTPGATYATQLVAFNQEVKARLEAQVPLSSLLPGTFDLDNNPVINAQYVELYEQDAAPSPVGSVYNYQGNLWYVSAAGAAQITSGNSLNAASLGGIDGDYGGGNPASLRFVDADETYYFYDAYATGQWGHVDGRSFNIHGGATETDRVRLSWAGSTSYTLTLPSDPPAANGTLLQMDTSGTVTASSTGLDSITLATNESFTVSGTGDYKHGEVSVTVPVIYPDLVQASGAPVTSNGALQGAIQASSSVVYYPLRGLVAGDRIKSIKVYPVGTPAAAPTYELALNGVLNLTSFATVSPSTTTTSSPATITPASPQTIVCNSSHHYFPWVKITTGASSLTMFCFEVTYDRP